MKELLQRFVCDESGGATVDWVVGTAGALVLTLAVSNVVTEGATALAETVGGSLSSLEIPTYGVEGG